MIRYLITIVSSIIIGGSLVYSFCPRTVVQQIDSDYSHLYTVTSGVVHRQKALIEMLNLRGVLTTTDTIKVRQMRGQA